MGGRFGASPAGILSQNIVDADPLRRDLVFDGAGSGVEAWPGQPRRLRQPQALQPPSYIISAPVMNEEASLAR